MNARNHKEYTIAGFDSMQAALATQRQPTPLLLAPVGDKTVELDFGGGRLSSDAGLILLKDIDDQLGLTRALAAVLADSRDARRIHFTPEDLLIFRVNENPFSRITSRVHYRSRSAPPSVRGCAFARHSMVSDDI